MLPLARANEGRDQHHSGSGSDDRPKRRHCGVVEVQGSDSRPEAQSPGGDDEAEQAEGVAITTVFSSRCSRVCIRCTLLLESGLVLGGVGRAQEGTCESGGVGQQFRGGGFEVVVRGLASGYGREQHGPADELFGVRRGGSI